MKKVILSLAILASLGATGCTTGQAVAGVAGAGAGYIIGRETKD